MFSEVYTATHSHKGEYNIHNAIAGMRPLGRPVTVILAKSAACVCVCVSNSVLCLKQEKLDSSCSDTSGMFTVPHKPKMKQTFASNKNTIYK